MHHTCQSAASFPPEASCIINETVMAVASGLRGVIHNGHWEAFPGCDVHTKPLSLRRFRRSGESQFSEI